MKINIHHYHHHFDPQVDGRLRDIEYKLGLIMTQQEKIMATLDDILTDVTDESTQIDGMSTLIAGLKQQVADALSGATLPAGVQTKVDAIFAQAEANKGKIVTALGSGT